jgi:hypothetical protein
VRNVLALFRPPKGTNQGVWRELETGTKDERAWPENADASFDQTPIPQTPIVTDLENYQGGPAMVLPWFDAKENPQADTGLYASPDPTYPHWDVGGRSIVGAYEGAVRTRGPVYQFGHEVSGGLWGDQELGRIMRFPANIPSRYDPYNDYVWNGDQRDDMAQAVWNQQIHGPSDDEIYADLIGYAPEH